MIKIHADWHDNSRKLANFFEEIAGQRPQMAFVVAHVDKIPLEQVTQCQGTWFHYWFLAVLLHFITVPTFRFESELKYYFKSRQRYQECPRKIAIMVLYVQRSTIWISWRFWLQGRCQGCLPTRSPSITLQKNSLNQNLPDYFWFLNLSNGTCIKLLKNIFISTKIAAEHEISRIDHPQN